MTPGQTKLITHLLKEAVAACDDHLETIYEEHGFQRPYTFKQDGAVVHVFNKRNTRDIMSFNRARSAKNQRSCPSGSYREIADYLVHFVNDMTLFKVTYTDEMGFMDGTVAMHLIFSLAEEE